MLTPSMSASSTSPPCIICVCAFSTHVTAPPFLNQLPLADAMTTGLAALLPTTAAACPKIRREEAAARPATAPVRTKSRRENRRRMGASFRFERNAAAQSIHLPAKRREEYAASNGFRGTRPLRTRDHAARALLHLARDLRAGAGADLLAPLGLRRPRLGPRPAGRPPLPAGRRGESHRRPGQGRQGAGLLQR